MDKGRSSLGGLYQVRTQGIEQQGDNTSAYAHVFHSERFVVLGNAEQDIVYAAAKVVHTCRKAHNRHNLRGRSDVETCLSLYAVFLAQARDNLSQATVVDVHHTAPKYFLQFETFCLVLETIVVQQGCYHVVGCCDGMEVASKVKVDLVHWQYLSIAATCSSTLHAEARS